MVSQPGTVINVASITASNVPDPDSSNNSSAVILNSGVTEADLSVGKTVDTSVPSVSDVVTFAVTVNNNGPNAANGVVVADLLPAGLTYLSDTSGGSYNPLTGAWNVGAMNVGSSSTLQIRARVDIAGKLLTQRI